MLLAVVTILLYLGVVVLVALYGYSLVLGGFAVVEGRSMEPLLHTGDLVFLSKNKEPEVGSIVVYKDRSGKYIIHRVIGIYEYMGKKCYVIKGDNNAIPDYGFPDICRRPHRVGSYTAYGVPEDRIVGVVIGIGWDNPFKIPYIGGLTILYKG